MFHISFWISGRCWYSVLKLEMLSTRTFLSTWRQSRLHCWLSRFTQVNLLLVSRGGSCRSSSSTMNLMFFTSSLYTTPSPCRSTVHCHWDRQKVCGGGNGKARSSLLDVFRVVFLTFNTVLISTAGSRPRMVRIRQRILVVSCRTAQTTESSCLGHPLRWSLVTPCPLVLSIRCSVETYG